MQIVYRTTESMKLVEVDIGEGELRQESVTEYVEHG
jgi:hypothetical protein